MDFDQYRQLMRTQFYRAAFCWTQLDISKNAVDEFHTLEKSHRIATSVGGTLTGEGGNFLIIDRPVKTEEAYSQVTRVSCRDWFNTTLDNRLNDPKTSAIMLVVQHLHVDNLVGRRSATGNWQIFILPVIGTDPKDLPLGDNLTWHRGLANCRIPSELMKLGWPNPTRDRFCIF